MKNYKLGFPCKILLGSEKEDSEFNFKTTTVKAVSNKNTKDKKVFLENLCFSNIKKLQKQLLFVSQQDSRLHMFRIGSELLPIFSHEVTSDVYSDNGFINEISHELKQIGDFAVKNNLRLSFHPGQFTVLGSANENTVLNSIKELEYHAKIFDWMGYSGWHPNGLAINIHAGSKNVGLDVLVKNIKRCSTSVQNYLTIENDEFSYSIEELEPIVSTVALVLDVHHEWINKEKHFDPKSIYVTTIKDSWRGVRPKIHYSVSKEEHIGEVVLSNVLPEINFLLKNGFKKTVLREHSNDYWNTSVNDYVIEFLNDFDVMCEAKNKNIASENFLNYIDSNQ
jgi:UV DNA damage endonuclease